ncbi:hypothetical protein MMC30_003667 [Trapelia coarctata]|nr:hypothetical protein [Trapelia coarctata]
MDGLSLAASVIAVINITATIAKSLNDLRTAWKDAPDDLLTLLNEITDFQVVLSSIRDICGEYSADALVELSSLPSRAEAKLQNLENILHYKILQHVPATGGKPSMLRWFKAREKIEAIRADLRDIRLQLATALASFIARYILVANKQLKTIEISVNELGNGQQTIIAEITKSTALALPSSSDLAQSLHPSRAGGDNNEDSISLKDTHLLQLGNPLNSAETTKSQEVSRISMPITPDWQYLGGPSLCLKAVPVVPGNAPIIEFARSGNVEGIKMLFGTGLASPFDVDPNGWTPLRHAVGQGYMDVCRMLIQAKADPAAEPTMADSPVSIALSRAFFGQSELYEIFPVWDAIPEQGYTRLHKIILDIIPGDVETELAISTADIDVPDILGQTPLFWAVLLGKDEIVVTLLKYNADVNRADAWSCSPLMVAASGQSASSVDKLLSAGADLHAVNSWGDSMMMYELPIFDHEHHNGYEEDTAHPVIEDITDESYEGYSVEDPDLDNMEDFADALETLCIHTSEPTIPQTPAASLLTHSIDSEPPNPPPPADPTQPQLKQTYRLPPPNSLRRRFTQSERK